MKKIYEKPQATVVLLRTDASLLLAASDEGTTGNAFARRHDDYDWDEGDWDDEL